MADLMHHRVHPGSGFDVPPRIYWAASIGLTLLAASLCYAILTSTTGIDASISPPMLMP